MQSEHWRRCLELFQEAIELPADERATFLRQKCGDDEPLCRKVQVLFTYHEKSGNFIAVPAFEILPELLAGDQEALVGQQLGHYRVESILGVGGMGVVYLARDERLGRQVGLKLLPPALVADEVQLERLKREARTASALNHPNIVTIHEIGEVSDIHYIATEFIEGSTLRERLAQEAIPPHEAWEIARQIASALSTAHAAGIVHRDIKPENIMLRPDGYVKLLDFGIAKFTPRSEATSTGAKHGPIVGTMRYMSPEQARGLPADARTDLWSLGVLLYEMLAGKAPFAGETPSDCIASIIEAAPAPLSGVSSPVPIELQAIVEKALRKTIEERYQTIEEMLVDLRHLEDDLETAGNGIVRRTKPRQRAAFLALAAGIVVAAAFAYSLYRAAPTASPNEKSIAVLPFENLSRDEESAFFAGGVQDEILSNLARLADLKVISRTSVAQYKTKPRQMREIARDLGVAYVVEGSVQRADDRIRVNAQLIAARTDTHLWAEHYDRQIADLFAIQTEIAQEIAHQLHAQVSAAEKSAIAERPTADLVAYAFYAKAREIDIWGDWDGAEQSLNRKVELLEKATERDPSFALAYCALARTHADFLDVTEDQTHLDLVKEAAEAALRVRPDLGEAHLELARYYFMTGVSLGDYDRARHELTIARRRLPNSSEALSIEGRIDRHQHRWDAALANLQKASALDPLNREIAYHLGRTHFEMRRYDKWEQLLTKEAASGTLVDPWIQNFLAEIKLAQGDPVAAQSFLEQVPLDFSPAAYIWDTRFKTALYLRDYDAAERVIAATPAKWAAFVFEGEPPESWADGQIALARGEKERAETIFAAARKTVDAKWGDKPKDAMFFALVARLDAGLGRKEDAIREALRAVELMPVAKDSLNGPAALANLALVYVWTGEHDRALKQLAIAATLSGLGPTYGDPRLNPCWDNLRGDPRFDEIVAAVKAASR